MGFVDVDEFIVIQEQNTTQPGDAAKPGQAASTSSAAAGVKPSSKSSRPRPPSIITFLREFEEEGALVLNWRMFGSSGHKARPRQPVTKAYTKAFPVTDPVHK
jgi:hypothetical protein